MLTPHVRQMKLVTAHCKRIAFSSPAAAAAAGDNLVWTSYTVYESVEAAFKHMRCAPRQEPW
jgi:hypothetical protein